MTRTKLLLSFFICILFSSILPAQQQTIVGANSLHAYFKGKTKPLRDLTPMPGTPREKIKALKKNKPKFIPPNFLNYERYTNSEDEGMDPVRQYKMSDLEKKLLPPEVVFDGIQEEQADSGVPDTNGDVGTDHYVQIVNASWFQIFSKDGTALTEPTSANTIWNEIGESSFSDPVIMYDEDAERWLITDLANVDRVLYGVSETSDPMGAWNLYVLTTPGFADYPKYGIWPNAYILTINEGNGTYPVYALNRQQMLAGESSIDVQRVEIPGINGGFPTATPMDWNSPLAPPSDEVFVVRLNDDAWENGNTEDVIEVWTIQIDWDDSNNTTSSLTQLPTAAYDSDGCSVSGGFGFACIPQPDNANGIDGIMTVIMNNVCYWNYGTHESAVLTFSVDAGNDIAGVRWMELRRTSGNDWSVYQEGTFAPEGNEHRFIGGIAINGKGDIGLAYSVSGENTYPSLRYTGRLRNDPLGEMTIDEYEFATGGGTLASDRFGDYAHMSVDPLNGSFWFTSEYIKANGNYGTKIVNFSPSQDTFDIAAITLLTPQNAPDLSNDEQVTIEIKNVGLMPATNINVGYVFEDGTTVQEAATIDTLAVDSIYTHTFAQGVDMSTTGTYTMKIFTNFPEDQNVFNDTLRQVRENLPHLDIAISNIKGLDQVICDSTATASFVLSNYGVDTLTSATIEYILNDMPLQSVVWTGTLASGESAIVEVTLNGLLNGENSIMVNSAGPNGSTDEVPTNDSYERTFQAQLNGFGVVFTLTLDDYPEETTWRLQDSEGNVLYSGGNYPGQLSTTITESWCLKEYECYTFTIDDAYGDGLIEGNGSYSIASEDGYEFASIMNVNFGFQETNEFCANLPCTFDASYDVTDESAENANDGAILVTINSGVAPFTYSIDGGVTTQENPLFSNLSAGDYSIIVTDGNGCHETMDITVGTLVATSEIEKTNHDIVISPNPSSDGVFRVKVNGLKSTEHTLNIQVVDALGRAVLYKNLAEMDDHYEGLVSLHNYPAGIYYLHFQSQNINQLVKIVRL